MGVGVQGRSRIVYNSRFIFYRLLYAACIILSTLYEYSYI